MGTDHDFVGVLEKLAQLVVVAVLDADKSRDPNLVLSVDELEELLVVETLSVEKTWVALNLRWSLNLHLCAIFEHLAAHLGDCLTTVLLQLDEGSDDVVLQFADELLSGVTQWVDVRQLSKLVHLNVFARWLKDSLVELAFSWLTIILDLLLKKEWVPHAHHHATIVLVHAVR